MELLLRNLTIHIIPFFGLFAVIQDIVYTCLFQFYDKTSIFERHHHYWPPNDHRLNLTATADIHVYCNERQRACICSFNWQPSRRYSKAKQWLAR